MARNSVCFGVALTKKSEDKVTMNVLEIFFFVADWCSTPIFEIPPKVLSTL